MAGPAPSNENAFRRTVRLAVGVTFVFLISQLFNWPLAFLAPVVAALLLQDATPMPLRQGFVILGITVLALLGSYCLGLVLLPYPILLLIAFSVVVFRMNLFLVTTGAHLLAIVAVLISALVLPIAVRLLPELAEIAGVGVFFSFVVAVISTWIIFLFIPAPPPPAAHAHPSISSDQAFTVATRLTIVLAPLLVCFLMFGWTDILVLVYSTIVAVGLNTEKSVATGWKYIFANLVLAGLAMLIVFELLVMVPTVPFMSLVVFVALLVFGRQIFSGEPNAGLWGSGLFGFLLLLGPVLQSNEAVSVAKLLGRVWQITLATTYVAFVYSVVDLVGSCVVKKPTQQTE